MHWPGRQEKARKLLNFNFLFAWSPAACHAGQKSSAEMTMLNSSAEVTMMESQNHKRAPAWNEREGMKDRGHNRDPKQCHVKLKELRQAYQKTREANGHSRSEPQTCRFYDELHAILGGSATTTPAVLFDSFSGDGGNTEAGFGDEEDDDDEVVDSSQQASGETGFPDSQELFLTLDLEPVPPNPPKASSRTRQAEKGPLLHVFQGSQDLLLPRG
nr:zinc finger and SCAN domain-containing protein 32-like [Caretta caretta]